MEDVRISREGKAGRVTLTRPKALNSLNHEMCLVIDEAIWKWADDPSVALVVIDAEGDRAFCAGGDIAMIYEKGREGDYSYGRGFWRDEYRMNTRLSEYPKPVVSLMQGFIMGGGVGLGGHVSHRIVCESSQVAMPECGIGLIPDVGGTLLLAKAPGRVGEYIGLTGARMGAGDAIYSGFANLYVPQEKWPALIADLCETGDVDAIGRHALPAPASGLAVAHEALDRLFAGDTVEDIAAALGADDSDLATKAKKAIDAGSPLSLACTLKMIRDLRAGKGGIREALTQEYRFTHRSMDQGDFLEGIRAAIIDKDKQPRWRHPSIASVSTQEVETLLAPLGAEELSFKERWS
ncbi:MAG: enoyl-CoA hydratase/isomerase family protein [Rhodobiaceae bacterium]|nr:enoyl-CoA hydratase/isomerase family protein [Rhodobiaceae bacterium]